MELDFLDFKDYCETPGVAGSNKSSSYVNAIGIVFDYLQLDKSELSINDFEKIKELKRIIKDKTSSAYLELLSFVSNRNQKSYLENGFISAALSYFIKWFEEKGGREIFVTSPKKTNIEEKVLNFTSNPLFIRYITALLAKPFVILTGNSGTGKTRIAKRFAKYLERKIYGDVTNCLLVPVGADWTDNTKIMGYYNPLANNGAGEYVKTDILKFIELANANPDIPFFLILDEMNLSHVERYFSDFLSKMETPDDPFDIDHYGKVPFPKNLFVTGTVNIDETTYMFSPKVLDRANVIEFIPDKEDVLRIFSQKPEVDEIETVPEGVAENFIALARDVRNYSNGPLTDAGANLNIIFGELYDILKTAGFEFAYRTTKEIVLYYCAAHSLDPNVYTYKVIDEQIVQKILPKIHGNKKQIGNLLYKLKEFLEDNAEEDEFLLSRTKIQAMIEKLEKFQYASFI